MTGPAGERIQEIGGRRAGLARLSRASPLINESLDLDAVRQRQPAVVGVCLGCRATGGNVPQEGHPPGLRDAAQVTSGATRNLKVAVCRRCFVSIVLRLHRLGGLLHYTP